MLPVAVTRAHAEWSVTLRQPLGCRGWQMLGSWQSAGTDYHLYSSVSKLVVQVGLGKVQVWAISFGQIRDLWVPMLVLAISLFTAIAAGYQVLTSPAWYAPAAAYPGSCRHQLHLAQDLQAAKLMA